MSDSFPDTRGTCIPRILGVKSYLNNYIAMYPRLTHSLMREDLASSAYLGLEIIWMIILPCRNVWRAPGYTWNSHPSLTWGYELFKYLFCDVYSSDALSYTLRTRIPCLLGFKNYLRNYFAVYKCLTHPQIRVDFASPAYLGLRII